MAVALKDKVITVEGLNYYDEHGFPVAAQSAILTVATAHRMLQEQVDSMDGSKPSVILPVNPDPEPISPGAIWLVVEE